MRTERGVSPALRRGSGFRGFGFLGFKSDFAVSGSRVWGFGAALHC